MARCICATCHHRSKPIALHHTFRIAALACISCARGIEIGSHITHAAASTHREVGSDGYTLDATFGGSLEGLHGCSADGGTLDGGILHSGTRGSTDDSMFSNAHSGTQSPQDESPIGSTRESSRGDTRGGSIGDRTLPLITYLLIAVALILTGDAVALVT